MPPRAGVLQRFIREFFDQNPLSHLGVVAMRNGTAQRLTELSASPVRAWSLARPPRHDPEYAEQETPQKTAGLQGLTMRRDAR